MKHYRITTPKKVLILGSGAPRIGQAGEYDNAGLQALRALKDGGITTVLINPNMTAVQTSASAADSIYFLPVTAEFAAKVIEKEQPDSLIVSYGGKDALYCALELEKEGILEKHSIQILGTSLSNLALAANRDEFSRAMKAAGIPTPASFPAATEAEAIELSNGLSFPVLMRTNGSDEAELCNTPQELSAYFNAHGPLILEEWLGGWKEIECVTVRDAMDNCVLSCTLECIDPVGIHSGDSIVVSPCQSLTDCELQAIRDTAFATARALGVIGEVSLRFAKDPASAAFRLLEANPRVSRSTALASKATGVPLGYLCARIALGFSLSETENKLSGTGYLCSEPSPDYLAIRMPRWDFSKFSGVDPHLGHRMKSVGEALAFGKTVPEALQKAARMTVPRSDGIACHPFTFRNIREELKNPTDLRIFAVYSALAQGWTVERIHKHTRIDPWFIAELLPILDIENRLRSAKSASDKALLAQAKQAGFSDNQIALCIGTRAEKIRALRRELSLHPFIKQIDGSVTEHPSKSNVLYMTYNAACDDVQPSGKGTVVAGSGAYHIGSSLEYDWCCYHALKTLKKSGIWAIAINNNPAATSTESEAADRVYCEELSLERVLDIMEAEQADNILTSYGGQVAGELTMPLHRAGISVGGTDAADKDRAENHHKFSALCNELGIKQSEWAQALSPASAREWVAKTGFPILVRPNGVEEGPALSVAWDQDSFEDIISKAGIIDAENPVILSRYIENSREIEIDAIANNGEILVYAISEHIENAGVHSGDATVVLPAQRIYLSTARAVKKAARRVAERLNITGAFNLQFLAKSDGIMAISCTARASRSLPFCSKVFGTDMVEMAVRAQMGLEVKRVDGSQLDLDYVGVRAAQFSYSRLKGADPVAGVTMASTGEAGCLGRGVRDAFMKAFLSTGYRIPMRTILLSTGPIEDKVDFIDSAKKLLAMGYRLAASGGTARFLKNNGIYAQPLAWPLENKKPNIEDALRSGDIDLVINIPKNNREVELKNDAIIRSLAVDLDIPLITNIKIAKQFIDSLEWYKNRGLEVKSREEYR